MNMKVRKQEVTTKIRVQTSDHHHQNIFHKNFRTSAFVFHLDLENITIMIKMTILSTNSPPSHENDQNI